MAERACYTPRFEKWSRGTGVRGLPPGRKWGTRMSRKVRGAFWVELLAATASGIFFLLEIFSRDWIERLFGIDPDAGNGSLEWVLAFGSLLVTVTLVVLARREWSRAATQS